MSIDFVTELGGKRVAGGAAHRRPAVTVATVVNNLDSTMQGRVQVHLPWATGLDPWAAVAAPMVGIGHGSYCMPQIGQQVLVVFNNGDIGEPYVIGVLWNAIDRPPILAPTDAVTKRVIRTPLGHEVSFDEATQTLSITSSTQQQVRLDPAGIELQAGLGAATVQLGSDGSVRIVSATSIELSAPRVAVNGATSVEVTAGTSATVNGGGLCTIQGGLVKIN
jgi:uncharacterized protein involved in type VI secretion and phage assembly